ncbi:hypothetical protein KUTeg_006950 [Tegillarca granosa]|uniref:Afadin n=1 Tax=Tegillarca granosa TaxID=220873 RepID=A0ABQ9FEU9_TEGGR|nr:hypothetical protein KUTeg_006950 [Tegillarca granosa]
MMSEKEDFCSSEREKKEKKKQDKKGKENDSSVAEKLYTDMPESTFTRSISNPEAVMKRRRQQKVEKKLQQCRGQDGHGGTLKIYGETLKPDIPYKTLLLSTTDNVAYVIKEAIEKYGLEKEIVPEDLSLVQVLVPPEVEYHGGTIGEERIMEDHECPLAIAMQHPQNKGTMLFQLKLKPDSRKGKHKKMRSISHDDLRYARDEPPPVQKLPYLIELNPDGSDNPKGKVHRLNLKFTEVGCDRSMYIQILGPNIQPRHCVIGLTHNDGIVTVTPTSPESETYVNNQRVYETTTLQNGMTKMKKGQVPTEEAFQKRGMPPYGAKPPETNFDVDGRVETMDGASSRGSDRGHPQDDIQNSRSPHDQSFGSQPDDRMMPPSQQKHLEEALPAALEFRDEKEDAFLSAIILDGNNASVQFKLSPTYILYMAVRYCLSNAYRPDMTPSDRALRITALVNKIANMSHQAIQTSRDNPAALAFWMANASEILHFYKQDHDIHPFSQDAQEMLAESVQMAFHHLVRCLQYDLQRTMPAFLDENDNVEDSDMGMQDENRARYNRGNKPTLGDVLDTLSSAMNLLRRCRVNAALTIQLFSQLFHFINMWLFNILVANQRPHQFCTRSWGMRLKRRLGRIEAWAEKQGLELAADCHLCRIIQAAHLLQAPKSNPDDIADISSTCFKLNSLQLRELLQRYIPESNEPPIPQNLIESIVGVAENMADELTKTDGREVRLEEDPDLQLPFLLPEDGYSCLCRMVAQPSSRGDWTVYMSNGDGPRIEEAVRKNQQGPQTPEPRPQPQLPKEPEVVSVTFNKVKGSMGLSIVAAKEIELDNFTQLEFSKRNSCVCCFTLLDHFSLVIKWIFGCQFPVAVKEVILGDGQKERGIYIKSVDGRLQAGDQLLEVDGKSLVGLTQEKAAELMTRTGQTVTLKVAKQGAFYHGLATLLSQPSPIMQRASPKKPASPMINKQRPQEEGPPPYNGNMEMDRRHLPGPHTARQAAMQSPHSRSSPSLNKYRKGVTHKDMENIYSRNALWRLVLQAEKNNLVAKSFGNHLPESIKTGSADQNNMDGNVRVRSKSVGALDTPKIFNENVHTSDRKGNIENVPLKHPVAQRPDGYNANQRVVVLQKSNSMGRNGFIDYRNRIQSETDLRNTKIRNYDVDIRDLQAEVRQMKKLQTVDDSRIQYGNEVRGRLRQRRMTQQERRQRSRSTSDLHRMQMAQMNGGAFQGYDINGGVGENDHTVMQELHDKMQNFLERKKEKQADKIKRLKELIGYKERVPLSPLNDYNQKVQKPRNPSSGYHSLSGTSDMSVSDDVFNNDVVMREKRGRQYGNMSKSEGDRWNLDYDSVFRVRSNASDRSYDNSSMLETSRRRQKAQHDNRNRVEKSRSFSYGTQSLPRNIENYRKPRGPIPNFHGVQRSLSALGPPRYYRDNRLVNQYSYRNDSMRDSYSSVSVTSDSYRLSDGYIHSQQAPVGFITRHPRSKSITSLPIRDGTGSDRGRPSARDMRDHHHSPHMQQSHPDRYQQREMDPKSKSIPNLRMDTSFEQKDPHHNMRPAASVGALQNAGNFHDYYNQRPDPRDLHGNDYENTPNMDPRFNKPHQDMRNDRGYPEGQHMPPGGLLGKSQHLMERGPPSSRTSSASVRDDRPHSAYYPQTQDRPVVRNDRPVSMEVNPNRVEDWQHRYGLGRKQL